MIILFNVLLGLCLGSFFHVIIVRMEKGESFIKGRSKCDSCNNPLKWYDLIPILSYILLGGKCRYCESKIDKAHLISELLIGLGFGIVGYCLTKVPTTEASIMYVTIIVIGISAISDLKTQEVYSVIVYTGWLFIAALRIYQFVSDGNIQRLIGACTISVLLAVFLFNFSMIARKYVGGGDFDVAFLLFLSCGGYGLFQCLFYGSVIGLLFLIPALVTRNINLKTCIPFVPLLYLGYVINLIL